MDHKDIDDDTTFDRPTYEEQENIVYQEPYEPNVQPDQAANMEVVMVKFRAVIAVIYGHCFGGYLPRQATL